MARKLCRCVECKIRLQANRCYAGCNGGTCKVWLKNQKAKRAAKAKHEAKFDNAEVD